MTEARTSKPLPLWGMGQGHTPMTELAAVLACPRCDTGLTNLHCRACRLDFPNHGGVPWLFADAPAAVSDWRNRWQLAVERLREDRDRVNRALADGPRPATVRRLQALADGYRRQEQHLRDVLAPIQAARGGSMETLLALRTRLPARLGILSYDANVHRDWHWGGAECTAAAGTVLRLLGEQNPQRILVLGAGAGRLAYELHQRCTTALTVALDLNPLLAYVGHRLSRGESLQLVEFPLAPRNPEAAALERTLKAPAAARDGLAFVLGDARRPPFLPGAFDLVVTPWLLDVLEEPAQRQLRRINQLLEPGGHWINQGSVAFDGPDPAERLTLEELEELAVDCGFSDLARIDEQVPYMNSPDSRHGRSEWVATVCARRATAAPAPGKCRSLPDWITVGREPVPALPGFRTQAMTTRMHAFIMSLIDGRRSLKDMAGVLEQQGLMSKRDAETALRGFLATMYEEAAASTQPH